MPRVLAFDCATPMLSVALFDVADIGAEGADGWTRIGHSAVTLGRGHAEALMPAIAALPVGGHADVIVAGIGPGSFTGTRIAIAAARALGFAWGAQVTGVSTLALIDADARRRAGIGADEPASVVIDGGHGEWIVQRFPADTATAAASGLPDDIAAVDTVFGNRATDLVQRRGAGVAFPGEADAAALPFVASAFRTLPLAPLYIRPADAKPAQVIPAAR